MSDNAAQVIAVCAVLASITLCSFFRAWRDRGVAKFNAATNDRIPGPISPDADEASANGATNER